MYHFHQRFHASTNFEFPRVAHFPQLSSKNGAPPPHPLCTLTNICMGIISFWRQSVSEVFVWDWPPGGGCKGTASPCLRKFCIWWAEIRNFITHFRQKLLNTHTKLLRKNMVRHRKLLLKMKEQKTDDPLSAHQKSYGPPFQLIKKLMTHPHILPTHPHMLLAPLQ